jgi:hypothetical protein
MACLYYTVSIPYDPDMPSEWHPTERTGPFSVLNRGAFKKRSLARAWAKKHLRSSRYSIKCVRD